MIIGPLFSVVWGVSMYVLHIMMSRISTIFFGNNFKKQLSSVSSGNGKPVFEQQYRGKKRKKLQSVFGMGMFIKQFLTD